MGIGTAAGPRLALSPLNLGSIGREVTEMPGTSGFAAEYFDVSTVFDRLQEGNLEPRSLLAAFLFVPDSG